MRLASWRNPEGFSFPMEFSCGSRFSRIGVSRISCVLMFTPMLVTERIMDIAVATEDNAEPCVLPPLEAPCPHISSQSNRVIGIHFWIALCLGAIGVGRIEKYSNRFMATVDDKICQNTRPISIDEMRKSQPVSEFSEPGGDRLLLSVIRAVCETRFRQTAHLGCELRWLSDNAWRVSIRFGTGRVFTMQHARWCPHPRAFPRGNRTMQINRLQPEPVPCGLRVTVQRIGLECPEQPWLLIQ